MKKNKFSYKVGDTVSVKTNMSEFTSVISLIRERLGRHNDGRDPMNPLITFENGETCDGGYITELVQRGKNVPYKPINRFAPKSEWDYVSTRTKNKRVICGTFRTLCTLYLGTLNEEIITEISGKKLTQASKSLTGVVSTYRDFLIYVKKDHFERWFKKNWKKILMTKKEYGQLETEANKKYEQDYYRSLELEWARESREFREYDEMEGIM